MNYATLTHRQTGELLKQLGNGSIGFDYKKHSLATLHAWIGAWIADGSYTPERVATLAAGIAAPVAPAMPPAPGRAPAAPSMPPAPGSARVAPGLEHVGGLNEDNAPLQSVGDYMAGKPSPRAAAAAAPVSVPVFAPAPDVIDATLHGAALPPLPEPDLAPVIAQAVAVATVAQRTPVHGTAHGQPRRVAARELFADQPSVAAMLPDTLQLLAYDHPDAPAVDAVYQFDGLNTMLALIAVALERPIPTWLAGPKGTGKTEFARQIAARLGRPFFRVGFNRATEPAEILGDMGLRDGATVWQDGPVAQALRTPGAVLLLDEISYSAQGYLASLNPVLERNGAPVRMPRTGEQLTVAQGVCIFAADNTLGHGDTSGEYTARSTMSADTLDRFTIKLVFDYLPADAEARLLRQIVARDCGKALKAATAAAIIKTARTARAKGDRGELQGAPGLRACIGMALLMAHGVPAVQAYEATVTRAAPPESHEELRALFAATWPSADADVNNATQGA